MELKYYKKKYYLHDMSYNYDKIIKKAKLYKKKYKIYYTIEKGENGKWLLWLTKKIY